MIKRSYEITDQAYAYFSQKAAADDRKMYPYINRMLEQIASGDLIVSKPKAKPKPKKELVLDDSEVLGLLPLNNGDSFDVTENYFNSLSELYPAVDVGQELNNMLGWLDSNPTKRKTKTGIKKFITSWLSRKQDKGGNNAIVQANKRQDKFTKSEEAKSKLQQRAIELEQRANNDPFLGQNDQHL